MRKMNFKIFFVAIIFVLSACSDNSIKEPKQIGKQVFKILKNISNSSKADYIDHFISIEEIIELGKNGMQKEEWIIIIEKDYNKTKKEGVRLGIKWNEIEYIDFTYELKEKGGISGCEGELLFKYNDKPFVIKVSSVFSKKEYRLVKIEDLNKQQ